MLEQHKHKMKAVEALKTLCEDDILSILDSTKAIEDLFDNVSTTKDLIPADQIEVIDELLNKYREYIVFSAIVSKMNK